MRENLNAPPLNPLPWVVWLIALPIIAMEVVVSAGGSGLVGGPAAIGWRLDAVQRLALSPEMLRQMLAQGVYPPEALLRVVAYPLVHGSFTHAAFVVVMLLALGKMVGEIFRWWAVLLVFFGAAMMGGLVYAAVPTTEYALLGGYPAVYGLIGAFTFLVWVRLAGSGGNQWRAFSMIGFLLGVQLLFGVLFGGSMEWVADLAGFATGFLLSFVVSPGGWTHVKARLRAR